MKNFIEIKLCSIYVFLRYPDIFFVKKSKKQSPKQYTGQLELRDLLRYVAKESTNELYAYNRDGNMRNLKIEF